MKLPLAGWITAMMAMPSSPEGETRTPGWFTQFVLLAGPFWKGESRARIRKLAWMLVGLTVLQIVIAVGVTEWNAGLFNALEQHSASKLWTQVWLVLLIIAANMAVTYYHLKIKRRIQLEWRNWLTDKVIGQWMNEGHHHQVTHMPGRHDNPDGRIAEDIRIATEYAIDLCHSLFYAILLLFSFTKVLWSLSGSLTIALGQFDLTVPGILVWLALVYAAAASYIGWRIGLPLTAATDSRQTEEANFRFGLVRARENSEAIALVRGEMDERRRFHSLFLGIVEAWQQQTRALANILLFTSGYSLLTMALPLIAAAPRYLSGAIPLGALVQSAQAFQQMAAALSWPVDNLAKVAEWRASVERVLGLETALRDLEEDIAFVDENTITVEETLQASLIFHDMCIADPEGNVLAAGFDATILPGERVFLYGDPAVGARIFKVVAGLWPWGCGKLELPKGEVMFFMPPRPYLPIDTLHAAVSYPSLPDAFDREAVIQALTRVGLEELIERLDESDTWEKELSREQQQRLGFARLLLHKPHWILLQEALDSLHLEDVKSMMAMVLDELPKASILTVTYQTVLEEFHHRRICLECPPCGMVLKKETRQRREIDRRFKEEVTPMRRLVGTLRKDRRKP